MDEAQTKKRMKIMLVGLGLLFGAIFIYKLIGNLMLKYFMSHQSQVVTVSAMKVGYESWQPKLAASGSLRAIHGVNVTTELAGMVQTIYFKPGADVKQGDVLVQLNADNDIALLHSLQANAELAKVTYLRDVAQFKAEAVSKQVVDTDAANLKSLNAQVAQQAAIVVKKTIRAPFTGRLGINLVNLGQYVNPGDTIVMLQTLNPLYADFYMPQQALSRLRIGLAVHVTTDAFPNHVFEGKVTTINPGVDVGTRNVEVEATIDNPTFELAPGMFASVEVESGDPVQYLTLPQAAIAYNPYGSLVYILRETAKDWRGHSNLIASQAFVETGDARGDQVAITKGLKEGEMVVTSGQLKLKNGSQVTINNDVVPANSPTPELPNEH